MFAKLVLVEMLSVKRKEIFFLLPGSYAVNISLSLPHRYLKKKGIFPFYEREAEEREWKVKTYLWYQVIYVCLFVCLFRSFRIKISLFSSRS